MTDPVKTILIINQDLATDPRFAHIRSPVTVEHSPHKCPLCNDDCWIGPKQKLMAALGTAEVLCCRCAFKLGYFNRPPEIIGLNPAIEDVPRRFGGN